MLSSSRTVVALFLIALFALKPAATFALVIPPDAYDGTERYALLVADAEGKIISAQAKVPVPGEGSLFAIMAYRSLSSNDHRFRTSRSPEIPLSEEVGLVISRQFDFAADPLPADAYYRSLTIYYQPGEETPPIELAEYRPEQLVLRTIGKTVSPENQTARDGVVVFGPVTILREREKPRTESVSFSLPDSSGRYMLRLRNGDPNGGRRVASAVVMLNNREAFRPSELNQHVAGLTRQIVPVSGENKLDVRLRSAPGAVVTLEIVRQDSDVCRALGPQTFTRATGKPNTENVTFSLNPQLHGPFVMNVINGNEGASHRADSAVITLNGEVIAGPRDINEQVSDISRVVSLQETNSLSVELAGAPGDTLTLEMTGYDSTPPVVAITSPANGAILSASTVTVTGTIDDPYATVTVNGMLATTMNGMFTVEGMSLQEGDNTITVRATDSCGNEGQDQVAVKLQTVVPKGPDLILCVERFDEQKEAQPPTDTCNSSGYAQYVGLLTGLVDESAVSVTLNGIPMPDGVEIENQGDIYRGEREGNFIWVYITMPSPDGPHTFTVVATNSEGRQSTATATIIRDMVSPRISITSPPNYYVTSGSRVDITVTVDDPDATLWFSSAVLTLDNQVLSGYANLKEGSNYINVYVRDFAWNSGYAYIYVIKDTVAPTLTVTKPTNGLITRNKTLLVSGVINDATPFSATVSVNGGEPQALAVNLASFSGSVALEPGQNTIAFAAKDKAGHESESVSRTVYLDQEPPVVSISSPLPFSAATGTLMVSVSATDVNAGVKSVALLVDGQTQETLIQAPYGFAIDTMLFSAGTHTLTARALDLAGNQSLASIPITVQSQLRVNITSPVSLTTINRAKTIVKGQIIQNASKEAGVVINGTLAHMHDGNFAGTVPLSQGQNQITAVVTDIDGLVSQATITINTVNPKEQIRLTVNPGSGIPMPKSDGMTSFITTIFSDVYLPNPVVNYSWDTKGNGTNLVSGATLTEVTASYQTPGLYYPKLTVTDSLGYKYTETTIVHVMDRGKLDQLLQAKWEGMKARLADQDIEGALDYFAPESQDRYRVIFSDISPQLPKIVEEMQPIQLIYLLNGYSKYRIRRNELYGGNMINVTYYIYFKQDNRGIWMLDRL